MQKVKVFQFVIFIGLGLDSVLSQPPLYNAEYAKIRFQPQSKISQLNKGELNLEEAYKEEVTEKSSSSEKQAHQNNGGISFPESVELTTERESEQINFARSRRIKLTKDKLREQKMEAPVQEAIIYIDDKLDLTASPLNQKNENIVNFEHGDGIAGDVEALDSFSGSELDDLNDQGVYYIIHPNGLFQKVVYKTQDEPENMQISTHVKYENIEPIVEPIYTYDPRTFVFQRLTQSPTQVLSTG